MIRVGWICKACGTENDFTITNCRVCGTEAGHALIRSEKKQAKLELDRYVRQVRRSQAHVLENYRKLLSFNQIMCRGASLLVSGCLIVIAAMIFYMPNKPRTISSASMAEAFTERTEYARQRVEGLTEMRKENLSSIYQVCDIYIFSASVHISGFADHCSELSEQGLENWNQLQPQISIASDDVRNTFEQKFSRLLAMMRTRTALSYAKAKALDSPQAMWQAIMKLLNDIRNRVAIATPSA